MAWISSGTSGTGEATATKISCRISAKGAVGDRRAGIVIIHPAKNTIAAPKLPQDKPETKPGILDHANHTLCSAYTVVSGKCDLSNYNIEEESSFLSS